jgi:hypothetical protein
MALDSRYVILGSDIQQLFRDKDTGLPLSSGKIYFYKDNSRTVPKPVYQLMGSPPNYTYVALPNPLILNSVGAFDQNVYMLPYNDITGNLELYFIEVYSSDNVFQFSVEAIPNLTTSEVPEQQDQSFVSNGQFLAHNNITANGSNPAGKIVDDITPIAYGGWYYVTDTAAGAVDNITFTRFDSYTTNPEQDPRYAINVKCTTNVPVSPKDLRLRFDNVNRFSSDTQYFTFGFSGIDNNGGNAPLEIHVIKNYGTGGTPHGEEDFTVGTITLSPSYVNSSISFVFGSNAGKTLGTNNDDYVDIAIRFPENNLFNISITDVYLVVGQKTNVSYPITTNSQDKYRSISGGLKLPDYDGADVGLPLVLTKTGIDYDRSSIGSVLMSSYTTGGIFGYLKADGSQYLTSGIDFEDNIPYSRLQSLYFDDNLGFPIYGTGSEYQTMIQDGNTNSAYLTSNNAAALTAVDPGTSGFTVNQIHIGLPAPAYSVSCHLVGTNTFQIINKEIGAVPQASVNTSTFTIDHIRMGLNPSTNTHAAYIISNVAGAQEITNFTTVAAATLAGKYITFSSSVMGFKVGGVGTDPMVAGTAILVNLETADNAGVVAQKIVISLNGFEASNIIFTAATGLDGKYLTCSTTTANYYVWYKVDNVGTDPALPGKTGIPVSLLGADMDFDVAKKTMFAINSLYFAVPDWRGLTPRGWSNFSGVDPDASSRFSSVPSYFGDVMGTYQLDSHIVHRHPPFRASSTPGFLYFFLGGTSMGGGPDGIGSYTATGDDGFSETRSKNFYVDFFIKF